MDDLQTPQDQPKDEPSRRSEHRRSHSRSSSERQHGSQHHRTSSGRGTRKSSVENIISNEFLIILASLFFVVGMVWVVMRSETLPIVSKLISNFFSAVEDTEHTIANINPEVQLVRTQSVLLFLLPGLLLMGYAFFELIYKKTRSQVGRIVFYGATAILYFGQLFFIYFSLFTRTPIPYENLTISVLITFGLTLPVSWIASKEHKARIHFASIGYMILMAIALAIAYGFKQPLVFMMLLLFGVTLYSFSGKITGNFITNAYAYFVTFFYSLFFIRKIFLKDDPTDLWFYFSFSLAFLVLLLLNRIFNAYNGKTVWKKWFADLSVYIITAFVMFTVGYALRKAGFGHSVWMFSAGVAVILYALLFVSERFKPVQHHAVFYYTLMFVGASIIPLLILKGILLQYAALLSILLVLYAKQKQHPFAALMATFSLSGGVVIMLAQMVIRNYSGLYFKSEALSFDLFFFPLLSGLLIVLASFVNYNLFKRISFPYSKKWFSRSGTVNFVLTLYYISLYLNLFWIVQYVYFSVWNNAVAHEVNWYVFHLFFLYFILKFGIRKGSWVYEPMLWISVISLLAWPLVMNMFLIRFRESLMLSSSANFSGFLFEFVGIIPAILLIWLASEKLRHQYPKFKEGPELMYVFRLGMLFYLVLAMFDHLTAINSTASHNHITLEANRHLPYTIALSLFSIVLMLFSFWKYLRILRRVSLVLLFIIIVKLFVYDFGSLGAIGQALSFWFTAGFLIFYSFLYKLMNDRSKRSEPRKKGSNSERQIHHSDRNVQE